MFSKSYVLYLVMKKMLKVKHSREQQSAVRQDQPIFSFANFDDEPGLNIVRFDSILSVTDMERSKCENEIVKNVRGHDRDIDDLLTYVFDETQLQAWGRDGFWLAFYHMDMLRELCDAHQIDLAIGIYAWPEMIGE